MEALPSVGLSDVSIMLLLDVEAAEIKQLLLRLELLNSINLELQESIKVVRITRLILDGVVR